MKLKWLEIELENIIKFQNPKVNFEQYQTPTNIASLICYIAYMDGNIFGKNVLDLGCGTGILSIGSSILGAKNITGIDIDINAINIAYKNSHNLKQKINFFCMNVKDINKSMFNNIDTVIMNPPFGSQRKGADRPFLKKALEIGNVIYTIHNKGSYNFIKKFIEPSKIIFSYKSKFIINKTFFFHNKNKKEIDVEIYKIIK